MKTRLLYGTERCDSVNDALVQVLISTDDRDYTCVIMVTILQEAPSTESDSVGTY